MGIATDTLDRRDRVDIAAAAIMLGLTFSWGLNYVAAKISYAGYVLWFWLLRRYPASGLSSFTFLSPVFGVMCGAIFLNEPLTIRIFLALGLIAAGLIIVNRPARKQIPG